MLPLVLNFLLFGAACFYCKRKWGRDSIGFYVLLFYCAGSFLSILVASHPLYPSANIATSRKPVDAFTFMPVLYMFTTLMLFFAPLFQLKTSSFTQTSVSKFENSVLKCFFAVFAICAVCFFGYVIVTAPSSLATFSLSGALVNKTDVTADVYQELFSSPLAPFHRFFILFSDFALGLGFFWFWEPSGKRKKMGLFLICVVLFNLTSYAVLRISRNSLMHIMLLCFVSYNCMRNFIPEKSRRRIRKISIVGMSLFLVPMILISLLRFGDNGQQLQFEILRYGGESFVNFNAQMYDGITGTCDGIRNFQNLRHTFLGEPAFDLFEIRTKCFSANGGVPSHYFYSFVGSLVFDFGLLNVFFIAVGFFVLSFFWKYIYGKENVLTFPKFIFVQTISLFFLEGYFLFNYFGSKNIYLFFVLAYFAVSRFAVERKMQ